MNYRVNFDEGNFPHFSHAVWKDTKRHPPLKRKILFYNYFSVSNQKCLLLLQELNVSNLSDLRNLKRMINGAFSLFNNVLFLLCVIFLTYMCCPRLCSHGGWLLLKCSAIGIEFNGAETNSGIARILGILLMNSWDTYIHFFINYHNLQSVYFEYL